MSSGQQQPGGGGNPFPFVILNGGLNGSQLFQHLFGMQQEPAQVEHRGVGHVFVGETDPRRWIDAEQHQRASDPPQQNNRRGGGGPSGSSGGNSSSVPHTASELRSLGNEEFRNGNISRALALYTEALSQNPDEVTFSNRAQAHMKLKNYDAAAVDARRAVQLAPNWWKGHYRLGQALSHLGVREEALASFKKALELVPSDQQTYQEEIGIMIKKEESRLATKAAAEQQQDGPVNFGSPLDGPASASATGSAAGGGNTSNKGPLSPIPNLLATPKSITGGGGGGLFPNIDAALGSLRQPLNGQQQQQSEKEPPSSSMVVSFDKLGELMNEAKTWRGYERKSEAFVSDEFVEALSRLTSKTVVDAENAALGECNPETLQSAIEAVEAASAKLREAAQSSDRERFHSALQERDKLMHQALKSAAKSRHALAKLKELEAHDEALRAVIDEQLHSCSCGASSSDDASSSAASESAAASPTSTTKKRAGAAGSNSGSSNSGGGVSGSGDVDVEKLVDDFRSLKDDIDGDVRRAIARTDAAAAEFVNALKEERRLLMSQSPKNLSSAGGGGVSSVAGAASAAQEGGASAAASCLSTRFKPLRDISARLVSVAREKLREQHNFLSSEQVDEVQSLIRRVEADRQQLQNARDEGQRLLEAESMLEQERLSLEKQRIQLAAEMEWIQVKNADGDGDEARKIESLQRHIARVKERIADILGRQKETQNRILELISSSSPELAWKAAASGKKVLRWAKSSTLFVDKQLSDFEIVGPPLSTTPSSRVLAARMNRGSQRVALKEILCETEAQRRRFKNEINVVSGLPAHRNILRPSGVFVDGSYCYQILPLYDGSLFDFLRRGDPIVGWRLQDLLRQIVTGVAHLHEHGVVHSDLKISNLLMNFDQTNERTPVISDFGISRDLGRYSQESTITGTMTLTGPLGSRPYLAPELESALSGAQPVPPAAPSGSGGNADGAADGGSDTRTIIIGAGRGSTSNLDDDGGVGSPETPHPGSSSSASNRGYRPTMKSDIYSLGITMLQLAANFHKFDKEQREQFERQQKEQKEREREERERRREQQQQNHDAASDHPSTLVNSSSSGGGNTAAAGEGSNEDGQQQQQQQEQQQGESSSPASVNSTPTATSANAAAAAAASATSSALIIPGSSSGLPRRLRDVSEISLPENSAGKKVDPAVVGGNERLADLLTMCLAEDPAQRPSVQELLSHPYFSTSMTEEAIKSADLVESNKKIEALFEHIHALRQARRNPVLISVLRDQMVESLSSIMSQLVDRALLNPFLVVFRGEEGLDDGGLTTEAFVTYWRQAVAQHQLFVESNSESVGGTSTTAAAAAAAASAGGAATSMEGMNMNSTQMSIEVPGAGEDGARGGPSAAAAASSSSAATAPTGVGAGGGKNAAAAASSTTNVSDAPYLPSESKTIPPALFEAAGKVLLKCLIENRQVSIRLSSVVWKYLCGITVPTLLDLEEYDRQLWRSLRQFQFMPAAELEACGLDFGEFDAELLKDLSLQELQNQDVTADNVANYIKCKNYEKLVFSRKTALEAMRKGFAETCQELQSHLKLMNPTELQLSLCGQQSINAKEVIELLDFLNFPSSSMVPVWLCDIIAHMQQKTLRRFIRFCTANVTLPSNRSRIKIVCTPDATRLPVAHTCVSQLDFPDYKTKEELSSKLTLALEHTETDGFFIV